MSSEGSIWVEGSEICYIDENGEKNCGSFSEMNDRLNEIQDVDPEEDLEEYEPPSIGSIDFQLEEYDVPERDDIIFVVGE